MSSRVRGAIPRRARPSPATTPTPRSSRPVPPLQLIIPAEAAHDTIAALGETAALQFKDLNSEKSAFQRTYASQVRRADEMARKLRFLTEQIEKEGIYYCSGSGVSRIW